MGNGELNCFHFKIGSYFGLPYLRKIGQTKKTIPCKYSLYKGLVIYKSVKVLFSMLLFLIRFYRFFQRIVGVKDFG